MSLLPTVNSGSVGQPYAVQNITLNGLNPDIATSGIGTVRIEANKTINPAVASIQTDVAAAGLLNIGSSATSYRNILLTDGATQVNTDLTLGLPATPGSGDIIFSNGATGSSISGYYSAVTQVVVPNSGVAQVIANPVGLTPGLHAITVDYTTAGNDAIALASVAMWTGAVWQGGAAVSAAGPGSAVMSPAAGAATLQIAQSGGGPVTANVRFRKILNAA